LKEWTNSERAGEPISGENQDAEMALSRKRIALIPSQAREFFPLAGESPHTLPELFSCASGRVK
jgi:hypothetical protein